MPTTKSAPIAVFDSGVGGLSVLRAIREQFPGEDILFLADQAHVPYGSRSLAEVRAFSEAIARYFLAQNAKLIVVACNTASAAALHHLREVFPRIPFVGMEPAVKPAAEGTHSGIVGVLATPATFQGELYNSVVERFANGVSLLQDTCVGLVEQIEAGDLDGADTRRILDKALSPMLAGGIDTVVLGCTHYPFVIPLIQEITGPDVRVIDPAPAVARQVGRLLDQFDLKNSGPDGGGLRCLTTADGDALRRFLAGIGISAGVHTIEWGKEIIIDKH
ncbi:MAG: glutamate racemase [Anaerolineales bacterium]|jgi:glutamate racemase